MTRRTRRVCITGMGAVSALGNSQETTWENVLLGENGVDYITQFDARTWSTQIAYEVKNFILRDEFIHKKYRELLNRPSEFGVASAWEAVTASGILDNKINNERFGISMGAGIGAITPNELLDLYQGKKNLIDRGEYLLKNEKNIQTGPKNHPATLAGILSAQWKALGPVTTIHTACASSGQSIGHAFEQIRRDEADIILAGGADSLSGELLLAGFCLLGALSKRNEEPDLACRPFDKNRDGFVAGEGAAMLILEEMEHAKKRGAKIFAEIIGYGETASAYRVTDLPPNGRGIVESMELALKDAHDTTGGGITLHDIGYINAHGTSTEMNDRIEALAIRRVFYSHGARPVIGSTKAQVGHLISAAGAMEAFFSIASLQSGYIPPTLNLEETDCGEDLDFISDKARELRPRAVMSNSVGFGGSNCSLIFKRCENDD